MKDLGLFFFFIICFSEIFYNQLLFFSFLMMELHFKISKLRRETREIISQLYVLVSVCGVILVRIFPHSD